MLMNTSLATGILQGKHNKEKLRTILEKRLLFNCGCVKRFNPQIKARKLKQSSILGCIITDVLSLKK